MSARRICKKRGAGREAVPAGVPPRIEAKGHSTAQAVRPFWILANEQPNGLIQQKSRPECVKIVTVEWEIQLPCIFGISCQGAVCII